MTEDLTPRQRQVLNFIQDSLNEHGLPPTRAEIAEALGFKSANAAEEHLRALQRKRVPCWCIFDNTTLGAGTANALALMERLAQLWPTWRRR